MSNNTRKPFYIIYLSAVYYACCVMVTVGYPPTEDPLEKIYSMFLMIILSVIIFLFSKRIRLLLAIQWELLL